MVKNKKVDYKATSDYIINWIEQKAKEAGAESLVIGLSGGIDSSLTAVAKAFKASFLASFDLLVAILASTAPLKF